MRTPQHVYLPDGTLLATSIRAAAAGLAVSRPTLYRMSEPTGAGRRLTTLNPPGRGVPTTRWILDDGREMDGARAAAAALGISRQQIYERAGWDDVAQAWRVRPRRPPGRKGASARNAASWRTLQEQTQ